MTRHDEGSAECLVFSFKEGLLSRIAHDLSLRVERFHVEVDETEPSVRAELEAASLRVVCAMKDGRERLGTLSADDRAKIEENLRDDVLHVRDHPTIRFESRRVERTDGGARVTGELTLHGVTRPLTVQARREGDAWVVEAALHQPDWGIKPFRAALGALKVKPEVRVKLRVPVEA